MNIRNLMLASVAFSSLRTRAFDPGNARWKLAADGKTIEIKDGNPIWIDVNGNETTLGGDTVGRLNGEAKGFRERAETAENKLKDFAGIDPTKARAAIEIADKVDKKLLIDAGKVDEVTNQIKAQFTTQLQEKDATNTALNNRIRDMQVDGVFATSQFINERVAMPKEFFSSAMRKHVQVGDDGKIKMIDAHGNPIFSKTRSGEWADPDEAMEIIVSQRADKDVILRAPTNSGSGGHNNNGRPGTRTVKRSEWEQKSPAAQAADATAMGKGELTIID